MSVIMKDEFDFDILGRQGRDIVTGVKGTITSVGESRSGSIQFAVEPKRSWLSTPETYSYDFQQIEVFKERSFKAGFKSRLPVVKTKPEFKLGQQVQDRISKTSGIITRRTTYMNGCILYTILPNGCTQPSDSINVFQPLIEAVPMLSLEEDLSVDWDVLNTNTFNTDPSKIAQKYGGPATSQISRTNLF